MVLPKSLAGSKLAQGFGPKGPLIQSPGRRVGRGLLNQPEAGSVHRVVRRRRTSRHRRNRKLRRVLATVFCAGLAIGFAFVAPQLPFFSPTTKSAGPNPQAVQASRNMLLLTEQESLRQMEQRPVYPYSIVPGGVRDARELKWAAEHDPVVRSHYAGFDYDHARLVRLVLARTVYVSYRIGSKVYWTRHRVTLKKGETVITDGKITARSRCGNRVEEVPQQATSTSEPPAAKFDEPVQPGTGTALASPPVPFQSALLNRPALPGLGPAPPLGLYDPLGSGRWVPIAPPPLPSVCGVGKKKPSSSGAEPVASTGKKRKGDPCGNGGGGGAEVPEPGTWVLFISGLAAIYWKGRQRFART